MYQNLFGQYLILYPILCTLTTIFYQIQDFSPVSPLKIFSTICSPQYCFQPFVSCQNEFSQSLSFHSFSFLFFFYIFSSSLLPFLCSLSFSLHAWNKAGICFTVSFSSAPHLSLPLFYYLLSTASPSYSTSLTW